MLLNFSVLCIYKQSEVRLCKTMAVIVNQLILLAFFVFIHLIDLSSGEIHRAKKLASKWERRNRDLAARLSVRDVALDSEAEAEGMFDKGNAVSDTPQSMEEVWINSISCSILIGLSGIFPLLVIPMDAGPSLKHGAAANRLKLLLSFAVGGLLGDVFLHLLPEAWAHINKDGDIHNGHMTIGLWILTGILSFLIIEKMFAREGEFEHMADECEEEDENIPEKAKEEIVMLGSYSKISSSIRQRNMEIDNDHQLVPNMNGVIKNEETVNGLDKSYLQNNNTNGLVSSHLQQNGHVKCQRKNSCSPQKSQIKISGYLNLMANVIDNFTHGLAVAGSFVISTKVGCLTTVAILLHEIPHEVGDFAILLRSGFDRGKAAKAQMLTATGGVLGAVTALSAESTESAGARTAWILPFTSGGFIYIALITVLPDLLNEKHGRESLKQMLCILAGIGVMFCVTLIH